MNNNAIDSNYKQNLFWFCTEFKMLGSGNGPRTFWLMFQKKKHLILR